MHTSVSAETKPGNRSLKLMWVSLCGRSSCYAKFQVITRLSVF